MGWIDNPCPIWGTPAKSKGILGRDATLVDSPRAGGIFSLTRSAGVSLTQFDRDVAVELTRIILQANLNGSEIRISSLELEQARNSRPQSITEKFNNFLRVGQAIQVGRTFLSLGSLNPTIDLRFLAALGMNEAHPAIGLIFNEIIAYLDRAIRRNLVSVDKNSFYSLTLDGEEFVEALGASSFEKSSIFVAMWFGSNDVNRYFDAAVKPAIEGAGYHCVRIDQVAHNERIDEMILAEIRKSRAVFADISCGLAQPLATPSIWSSSSQVGAPRGGVYFEAGFASGFGIPVIWSVQNTLASVENVVHFDIRQYNQVRWGENHDENRQLIQARIEATLGRGDQFSK